MNETAPRKYIHVICETNQTYTLDECRRIIKDHITPPVTIEQAENPNSNLLAEAPDIQLKINWNLTALCWEALSTEEIYSILRRVGMPGIKYQPIRLRGDCKELKMRLTLD